ncbi:MAG: hypothetical protein JW900_07230 [Anaerolineae bacterium]|nr:hypothetical protein [Anaerolineae bacterium]
MGKGVFLAIGGLVLGIVAVVVIRELAIVNEALAVVVGVIFGVAAAVPTSLLLLAVLTQAERQQQDKSDRAQHYPARESCPPVVVFQSQGPRQASAGIQPLPWHVIGGEDLLEAPRDGHALPGS